MSAALLRCALLSSLLLVACGGTTGGSADAGAAGDAGALVDAGSAADAGPGPVGPLSVSAAFESATLTRTGNALRVHVQDAAGTPVEGATVAVALWMPAHGHGAPAPTVSELGAGDYRAAAVTFSMAGDWDVTVSAVKGALTASQKLSVTAP